MNDEINNVDIIEYIISEECKGLRADQAIANENIQFSRSLVQKWIKKGNITVNNKIIKPKDILSENDKVTIIPEENINSNFIKPEEIFIKVEYEDKDLIVVNKDINIVSHPGAGNTSGTLANGLAYKYPELVNLPRSGLIHRLDKDTSGLLIVARSIESYMILIKKMQNKEIKRRYIAFVNGQLMKNGQINQPISRHRIDRKKMAVNPSGKEAITDYEVIKNYKYASKVRLKLHTGRTHQIRVHMQYLGYPIIGDKTYGLKIDKNNKIDILKEFSRQALHAEELQFIHPRNGQDINIKSDVPKDLKELEEALDV
tara:strand:+ start:867 stop:1808 length:942 start_codon:yes stop_codon:yes gene_type:complete